MLQILSSPIFLYSIYLLCTMHSSICCMSSFSIPQILPCPQLLPLYSKRALKIILKFSWFSKISWVYHKKLERSWLLILFDTYGRFLPVLKSHVKADLLHMIWTNKWVRFYHNVDLFLESSTNSISIQRDAPTLCGNVVVLWPRQVFIQMTNLLT